MKLSVKFHDETNNLHHNPLVRAKVPMTILRFPFLLGIAAGDSSDLSFSLRSNFSFGPCLSFSYRPTIPKATKNYPLSLCLKSGIGIFGSPHNSPLIFSANFNLFSSTNPNSNPLIPTFSLQIKPQFGDFSLFKSISSTHILKVNSSNSLSIEEQEQLSWAKFFPGILIAAKTCIPLAKRALVNLRWGVNFPPDMNWQVAKTPLPMLVVNKISLEKLDRKKGEEEDGNIRGMKWGELELLNRICGWMRREVEDLHRDNREIKQALDGMIKQQGSNNSMGKKNLNELENTKKKGDGKEKGYREAKKSEVEIELEKAIKATSS